MIDKASQNKTLDELAESVAQILRRHHGVERAPASSDYHVEHAGPGTSASIVVAHVDIGGGLVFPVFACWEGVPDLVYEHWSLAKAIARAVAHLHDAEPELSGIPRIAKRRIAKATDAGMRCRLLSVVPKRLNANRQPIIPLIVIELETLDDSLRDSFERVIAYGKADCRRQFANLVEAQARRVANRTWLSGHGATAAIDAVLYNALRTSGVYDAQLLRTLKRSAKTSLRIDVQECAFNLRWKDGVVTGSVDLEPGVTWNDGELSISAAARRFGPKDVGRRLVDIYPHPLLESCMMVKQASGSRDGPARVFCSKAFQGFKLAEERLVTSK
jgi:hypothetical protein